MHVVLDDARHYLETRSLGGRHVTDLSPAGFVPCLTNGRSMEHDGQIKLQSRGSQARLFVWSASDEVSLENLLVAYQQHLPNPSSLADQSQYFEDLNFTLSSRRSMLPWKTFLVCDSLQDLRDMIQAKTSGLHRSRGAPVISFVLTGQGAQWSGMGRELLGYDVFRTSLEEATKYLQKLGCTWSLIGTYLLSSPFSFQSLIKLRGDVP